MIILYCQNPVYILRVGLSSTEVQQGLYWSNIMKLPRVHLCYAEVCSELWESERARLWVRLVTSRDIRHLVYLGIHMYCVLDGTLKVIG